jgi:WD40 repeat protein
VIKWDVDRETGEQVVQGKYMTMTLSRDGRKALAATRQGPNVDRFPSVASFHDLEHRTSQPLPAHGSVVVALALDPTARIAVTGSADGIVRVGPVTGQEPHLLYGHQGWVLCVAVSPDGKMDRLGWSGRHPSPVAHARHVEAATAHAAARRVARDAEVVDQPPRRC